MHPGCLRDGHRGPYRRRGRPSAGRSHRHRPARHHRDDQHPDAHARRRRGGWNAGRLGRAATTGAWASSPGWGAACPRCRRGAACGWRHRPGLPDVGPACDRLPDAGDAAACPCPGSPRTGCCRGAAAPDDAAWSPESARRNAGRASEHRAAGRRGEDRRDAAHGVPHPLGDGAPERDERQERRRDAEHRAAGRGRHQPSGRPVRASGAKDGVRERTPDAAPLPARERQEWRAESAQRRRASGTRDAPAAQASARLGRGWQPGCRHRPLGRTPASWAIRPGIVRESGERRGPPATTTRRGRTRPDPSTKQGAPCSGRRVLLRSHEREA